MRIGVILFLVAILSACTQTEYERLERRELRRGVRKDSLFLGISFGMSSKDFYARCWELNKQGLLKEGPSNASVEYKIRDSKYPATMFFYPKFQDDKIVEMNCVISYNEWAPWNPTHHCDTLRNEMESKLSTVHKTDFIGVTSKVRGTAKVAVDGNKRITLFCLDDAKLRVIYRDLLAPETEKR